MSVPNRIEIITVPEEAARAAEWDDLSLLHEVALVGEDALPVEALIACCAVTSGGD